MRFPHTVALVFVGLFLVSLSKLGAVETRELFGGFFYVIGVLAAGLSAYQYYDNSRREKARWMFDLYQRFYQDRMRAVRIRLDWEKLDFVREPLEDKHQQALADLDDYLNFFEFVAYLEELGQISKEDVRHLFGYFLENLQEESIVNYVTKWGYGNLARLLRDLRPKRV